MNTWLGYGSHPCIWLKRKVNKGSIPNFGHTKWYNDIKWKTITWSLYARSYTRTNMLLCPCAGANDKCHRVLTQARIPLGLKFYDYVLLCPGLLKKNLNLLSQQEALLRLIFWHQIIFISADYQFFQPLYTRGAKNILKAPILNLSPLALQAPALTTRPWLLGHKMWNVFISIL